VLRIRIRIRKPSRAPALVPRTPLSFRLPILYLNSPLSVPTLKSHSLMGLMYTVLHVLGSANLLLLRWGRYSFRNNATFLRFNTNHSPSPFLFSFFISLTLNINSHNIPRNSPPLPITSRHFTLRCVARS
jgi:hypothetical protein